jgi:hypothetical protein
LVVELHVELYLILWCSWWLATGSVGGAPSPIELLLGLRINSNDSNHPLNHNHGI